jgi:fluoride exporter
MNFSAVFFVFIGGGIGSVLRFAISWWMNFKNYNSIFATLISNIIASILIAFVISLSIQNKNSNTQLFWAVGFCGGLSTFSTFSLQSVQLFQTQQYAWLAFNITANLLLTFLAVGVGLKLVSF